MIMRRYTQNAFWNMVCFTFLSMTLPKFAILNQKIPWKKLQNPLSHVYFQLAYHSMNCFVNAIWRVNYKWYTWLRLLRYADKTSFQYCTKHTLTISSKHSSIKFQNKFPKKSSQISSKKITRNYMPQL